jgi:hypothetical protein
LLVAAAAAQLLQQGMQLMQVHGPKGSVI